MLTSRLRTVAAVTCSAALALTVASTVGVGPASARSAPRCTVGGAVAALPFKASPRDPGNPVYDFMQFTTTRNSTYAGIAYRSASSDFYLVTRASGKKLVLLRKVHYPYAHATPNAVTAMGFTPNMSLVVAVQNPSYRPTGVAFGSYKGLYYSGRTAHYLAANKGWISYMPTSVSTAGRVTGWAATGSPTRPHYYVVTWAGVTSKPVVLADVGSVHPSVLMTGNGDIAWQRPDGYSVVRKADGSVHELNVGSHAASAGIWPAAASKDAFYAAATNGVFRWTVSGKTPSGVAVQGSRLTTGSSAASWIDTAGQRGDMIIGQKTAVLRLADGRQVRMPAQALPASAQARTISASGTVAFTSAKGRRVHFMSCR